MDWSKWGDKDMFNLINGVIYALEESKTRIEQMNNYAKLIESTNPQDAKAIRMSARTLEEYTNCIKKPFNNYVSSYNAFMNSLPEDDTSLWEGNFKDLRGDDFGNSK